MFNLTRQERSVIVFLAAAVMIGVMFDAFCKLAPQRCLLPTDQAYRRLSASVDINNADKNELMKIRGIGPVLAQRIIDYRGRHGVFAAAEDILRVNGIGKKKLQSIRDCIVIK